MKRRGLRGSFWPTPTQDALLRVALGPAEDAAARWHRIEDVDLKALETGSFGLLPLLYERLSEIAPDDPRLPLLLGTYRNTWYRNQLQLEALARLLPAFRARGVDPVLVGGLALVVRWYAGLGSRPVPQVELVVDPAAIEDARSAARSAGWRVSREDATHGLFVDEGGRALVIHAGPPPVISAPLAPDRAYALLREAAGEEAVLDETVPVLDPRDELVVVCALGARTVVPPVVQWLVDAARLLASPARPDVGPLLERARALHAVEPLRDTLTYVAAVSGGGLDDYLAALACEPARRRDSLAYRLGGAPLGRLTGLGLALAPHARATAADPLPRAVARLPRLLQRAWGAEHLAAVPALAVRKLARHARGARPTPPVRRRSATAARNRSASS